MTSSDKLQAQSLLKHLTSKVKQYVDGELSVESLQQACLTMQDDLQAVEARTGIISEYTDVARDVEDVLDMIEALGEGDADDLRDMMRVTHQELVRERHQRQTQLNAPDPSKQTGRFWGIFQIVAVAALLVLSATVSPCFLAILLIWGILAITLEMEKRYPTSDAQRKSFQKYQWFVAGWMLGHHADSKKDQGKASTYLRKPRNDSQGRRLHDCDSDMDGH